MPCRSAKYEEWTLERGIFSIKRLVNPPKNLPSGIFTQSGDEYVMFEKADDYDTEKAPKTEAEIELDEQLEEKKVDEKKLGGREYFCDECQKKLWFENNVGILKHKRSHSS
ncbi:hypothetical protein AAVH_25691 [Aphelenchoides avenae]|nr:hypothetical protein AAVH_25691 [Aphelenchus avenae]